METQSSTQEWCLHTGVWLINMMYTWVTFRLSFPFDYPTPTQLAALSENITFLLSAIRKPLRFGGHSVSDFLTLLLFSVPKSELIQSWERHHF